MEKYFKNILHSEGKRAFESKNYASKNLRNKVHTSHSYNTQIRSFFSNFLTRSFHSRRLKYSIWAIVGMLRRLHTEKKVLKTLPYFF